MSHSSGVAVLSQTDSFHNPSIDCSTTNQPTTGCTHTVIPPAPGGVGDINHDVTVNIFDVTTPLSYRKG